MIWYSLLIPVIFTGIAYILYRHLFIWWELIIPTIITTIAILISYYSLKNVSMTDIEYNGSIIIEARYYEPYETYVHRTCTRQVCTGFGKNRICHTEFYDCSYCDYTSASYIAIDNCGHQYSIDRIKYQQLQIRWKSKGNFVELNRDINFHGSCGKDGDMYQITWDGKIENSECAVQEHSFQNIVKVSHSAFQFPIITDEKADTLHLYHYPSLYDGYKQNAILGLDQFKNIKYQHYIQTKLEYLNGNLGPTKKVKVFTLLFKNQPINIAFQQEAYWDGGNQNEVITCIGLNDSLQINWVKVFSWCDNKRIIVDLREDIMKMKKFNPHKIYDIYEINIQKNFKFKSFQDFNYLTFEPTFNQLLFVYILSIIISISCICWCIFNNINRDQN